MKKWSAGVFAPPPMNRVKDSETPVWLGLTVLEGCSDLLKVVPQDYALELSIFVIQQLALHQNLVDFSKWFIGFISTSLYMS